MSHVVAIVSLVFVIAASIGLFYTQKNIDYAKDHPDYHPAATSTYLPDGGVFGCKILNHTYFNRSGYALIDVFAVTVEKMDGCSSNKTIRFYGEILQSCRCHNASQVNKTIDQEFPIGKNISCCLNDDCSQFNNVCTPDHPAYTTPSSAIVSYEFMYWCVCVVLVFSIGVFVCTLGYVVMERCRKKGYEALESNKGKT